MIIDKNVKFKVNISKEAYTSKTDATACLTKNGAKAIGKNKMAFQEQEVTVDEFMQHALNGYSFCNLFAFNPNLQYWISYKDKRYLQYPLHLKGPNKGAMKLCFKSDAFFSGAQAVFVDIDLTRFTDVRDYLDALSIKPTCTYMSFSDRKEKNGIISRRFRMVYVFSEILGSEDFVRISRFITNQIIHDTGEPMGDDCGCRKSQYFNGVYGNKEAYCSYAIYSLNDFPCETENIVIEDEGIPASDPVIEQEITFSENLVYEMKTYSYTDFMHYNSLKYNYFYRKEGPIWIDEKYQFTDESYLQLWWYPEKICDTQRRRKRLLKRACLRRLMMPDVDPDTLLFCMYVDSHKFFDNTDDILNPETFMFYCKKALAMDDATLREFCQKDIEYWQQNRPQFITKDCSNADIRSITGHMNRQNFAGKYDPSLSVMENADNMGISRRSAYQYCQEMGIETGKYRDEKVELFKKLYDTGKSLRQNREIMKQNGLNLSLDTIRRWKKEYLDLPNFDLPKWNLPLPTMRDFSYYYQGRNIS